MALVTQGLNRIASLWRTARPSGSALLIIVLSGSVLMLMAWAAWARIDEMVRAPGRVIAAARTQVVQSAQNGTIVELLVREGQAVHKGQLLARLDDSRARAGYDDSRNKVAALKAALARLHAEVYEQEPVFPKELSEWPAFRENQLQLFQRRRRALSESVAALEQSRNLAQRELSITEPLLSAGDVGQVEVLRLRKNVADIDTQIVSLRNRYFQDAQAEMTKAEEDLATQEEVLRERTAVLAGSEVRAPIDGLVNKINFTTLGAYVQPGDAVLEILPTASELIVEAHYPTSEVSSLRVGLPASVKLDAYDPGVYGALEGKVSYISPDALMEKAGQQVPPQGGGYYYLVRVRLDPRPTALRPMQLTAGMTGVVEVRSKKKTVMDYLLKPISKTVSDSLTER